MSKKTRRSPKSASTAATKAKAATPSRRQPLRTKKQIALSLLERPKGASIPEMQGAMGWQACPHGEAHHGRGDAERDLPRPAAHDLPQEDEPDEAADDEREAQRGEHERDEGEAVEEQAAHGADARLPSGWARSPDRRDDAPHDEPDDQQRNEGEECFHRSALSRRCGRR